MSAPATGLTLPTCCGQGGSWAPPAGRPVVVACQLCPESATYWRSGGPRIPAYLKTPTTDTEDA